MKLSAFLARSELARALAGLRREVVAVGALSLLINLLQLTPTLYMLQVYDRVLSSRSELTLLSVSLIVLVVFAVAALAERWRSRLLVRAGLRFDEALRTRVFDAVFEARLGRAAVPQRAFSDLTELRQFLTGSTVFAFFDSPWTPVYLAALLLMHPLLGVLALVFALVQAALVWFGHRRTHEPMRALQQAQADLNAHLSGKLRSADAVEAMGMLPALKSRWQRRHSDALARYSSAQALTHRVTAIVKWVRYSQQSLSLAAGALLAIDGQISPGALIAANLLLARTLAPIEQLASSWSAFLGARSAFERIEQLLRAQPARDLTVAPQPVGAVELRGVCARAPDRSSPILETISLRAEPGSVCVVLGPSGSGKSTLARVLVGVWPDVSGEVLLDGQPIAGRDRDALGPHVGYLPQDVGLFDGTIAENIARLGDIDPQRVIAAARSAGLHETILRLPRGYDTPLGDTAAWLSGGQRQRLALARALHGDPRLVVLDEPNANLDEAGELALADAVRALKARGAAVFLISHRPHAIELADRLLVLHEGRIQFDGSREQVLAQMSALQPGDRSAPAQRTEPGDDRDAAFRPPDPGCHAA